MCGTRALPKNQLRIVNNMVRSISPSPLPKIERSVFNGSKCPDLSRRRPSLEDDLIKFAAENKENLGGSRINKSRKSSSNSNVFRFSSSIESDVTKLPRINVVSCEDDVFVEPEGFGSGYPPSSSRLQLTPSTAGSCPPSPALYLGSSFSPLIGSKSPHLGQGLCCSTPNRRILQQQGLASQVDKLILGKGAYGTVVLGQLKGKKVAVKVLEKEQEGSKGSRRRKSLESELLASRLSHRHVVKVYGVYQEDERHAVVMMEYVGSRNLQRLVVEDVEKPLGKGWLLAAASQISSGLAHCHSRSLVHLDIKPANVLVTSSGLCKIGDFGCAINLEEETQETQGMAWDLVGTPGYQAPELLQGHKPSLACDIFSLGILLWQLDSRSLPFPNQHPQTVMFRIVALGARPSDPQTSHVGVSTFSALYKSCWAGDVESRPVSSDVFLKLEGIRNAIKEIPIPRKSSLKTFR